jgi:hypothetical protein
MVRAPVYCDGLHEKAYKFRHIVVDLIGVHAILNASMSMLRVNKA